MTSTELLKPSQLRARYMHTAVVGLCVVTLAQMISVTVFDSPLLVAAWGFALALPFSVAHLLLMNAETLHRAPLVYPRLVLAAFGLGPLFAVGGLMALLWHITPVLCIAFGAVAGLLIALVTTGEWILSRGRGGHRRHAGDEAATTGV